MTDLHIDYESHSIIDLKATGVYPYALSTDTGLTCVAWAIDDDPVRVAPLIDHDFPPPKELMEAFADPEVKVHAWNANFERIMTRDTAKIPVDLYRWRCTMVRAAYWGLPMSLEDAAEALRLPFVKDMNGHRLMKRMARPDKHGEWLHEDRANLERLMEYCANDVAVERAIARELPDLPDSEQEMWEIDQQMNDYGWRVDTDLIRELLLITGAEYHRLDEEFRELTGGLSPMQVQRVREWFESQGVTLAGLTKADIAGALSRTDVAPLPRRVLEIRQEIAKSSIKKLAAMLNAKSLDDRIRGMIQFYGASRTGRHSGRLVQIQNFPRPIIKDVKGAIRDILGR